MGRRERRGRERGHDGAGTLLSGVRLNKLLASRGVGSRRSCDALIQSGAVRVDGAVVREPGTRVEPDGQRVTVHGRALPGRSELRYYLLNKPVGVITTLSDPEGRLTVRRFLPPGARIFPVGRLDADTSGLLLLTNDGELAHRLMHPRYGVEKHYRVRLKQMPEPEQVERLHRGVALEPGVRSGPADVRVLSAHREHPTLLIRIQEGRYRQVRRMCEAVGLEVKALQRIGYGPLRLDRLPVGAVRSLSAVEVKRLREASARPASTSRRPRFPGAGPVAGRPALAERKPRWRGEGDRPRVPERRDRPRPPGRREKPRPPERRDRPRPPGPRESPPERRDRPRPPGPRESPPERRDRPQPRRGMERGRFAPPHPRGRSWRPGGPGVRERPAGGGSRRPSSAADRFGAPRPSRRPPGERPGPFGGRVKPPRPGGPGGAQRRSRGDRRPRRRG